MRGVAIILLALAPAVAAAQDTLAERPGRWVSTALSREVTPPFVDETPFGLFTMIAQCWRIDALSRDAREMIVTIGFAMTSDGRPMGNSFRLVAYQDGPESAARQAFEAARAAVMLCGRDGYDLPADAHAQWRDVEIAFDPAGAIRR